METTPGKDHHSPVSAEPVETEYFTAPLADPAFERDARLIAACYQRVFGTDRAWNEGRICNACSRPGAPRKWNLANAPETCPDCQGALEDFWPVTQIISDMRAELARPDAVCAVLRTGGEIIGCCWGFSATSEELDEHLNHGLPDAIRAPNIAHNLRHMYPGVARFAYQDEIFILPKYQRQGLGKRLFAARHEGFVERGLAVYVMRTKRNPPSTSYMWFRDGWGYRDVSEYPDQDERIILAHSFEEVARHL